MSRKVYSITERYPAAAAYVLFTVTIPIHITLHSNYIVYGF